jgi:hypothetical protein
MMNSKIVGRLLAGVLFSGGLVACYAHVDAGAGAGGEECRTVEVRNSHDVEVCRTRCGDEGCRTHCADSERWSREHHCWAD